MSDRGGGPHWHTEGGAKTQQLDSGTNPLRYVAMGTLYLFAQQTPSIWGNLVVVIFSIAAAMAVLGGLTTVFFRGFWTKTIEPMIHAAIVSWYSSEAQVKARVAMMEQTIQAYQGQQVQVEARKQETTNIVTAWHTSPEQLKVRKEFVRDAIDNHVRRDDGLIHKEIEMRVEKGIQPLHKGMAEIKDMLQEELLFRQQVMGKLGHMEGLLAGVSPLRAETPVHTPSRPSFPHATFPQPPVKPVVPPRGSGQ